MSLQPLQASPNPIADAPRLIHRHSLSPPDALRSMQQQPPHVQPHVDFEALFPTGVPHLLLLRDLFAYHLSRLVVDQARRVLLDLLDPLLALASPPRAVIDVIRCVIVLVRVRKKVALVPAHRRVIVARTPRLEVRSVIC